MTFSRALFLLIGASLVCGAPASADEPAILTVHVENISNAGGALRIALFDRKSYEGKDLDPVTAIDIAAKPGTQTVTFAAVTQGDYAIKMYQDVNLNHNFDQSWIGLPEERFGFSNNAPPNWLHRSPPSFDAAKIVLKPGANSTSIRLR